MDHKQVITTEEIELLEQMQTLAELGKNYNKAQALKKALMIIGAYKQVRWERDIAIQQLNELGYQFGEKIRSDEE